MSVLVAKYTHYTLTPPRGGQSVRQGAALDPCRAPLGHPPSAPPQGGVWPLIGGGPSARDARQNPAALRTASPAPHEVSP